MPEPPHPTPTCAAAREALSAHLDGEVAPLPIADARAHASTCPPCARFEAALPVVTRQVRVSAADAVPDLTGSILTSLASDRARAGDRRTTDLRILVAVAGVVHLALALPVLLGLAGPALHLGRDLGALELALGVGFLVAAYQPQRAAGVLPIATVAAGVVAVAVVIDLAAGRTNLLTELTHLTEVTGVVALWALTRRLPDTAGTRPATVV